MGFHRRKEREIKGEIGEEHSLEVDIKHHESDIEVVKKDIAEFIKVADKESQDIYNVEHDDIIFTFYVINKLQNVYNILVRLKDEGFPTDKEQLLEHKYAEAQGLLQEATKEAYKMEKYMKTRAHAIGA